MSSELPVARVPIVRATVTLAATIASFAVVYALCRAAHAQSTGPAIAAAVFSLGYGRRPPAHGRANLVLAPVIVAVLALATLGIGRLLVALPVAGAAVFVAAMTASVYARNFGGWIRRLGALVALPLVAMLVIPAEPARAPGGPLVDLALGASAGVISLFFAAAARAIAERSGFAERAGFASPPDAGTADAANVARAEVRPKRTGFAAPATRMAAQIAVALALAFGIGFTVFPAHWGWTVLTAFIVCGGARGRGDAIYKGVLRLAGALGGTIVAAASAHLWAPAGVAEAVLIFVLLYGALILRDVNYAYWAAGTTLILALLAHSSAGLDLALLGMRLEAILEGALCAVVATWFVFPIRTEDVIRRRLADALKALDDAVIGAHDPQARAGRRASFEQRMIELDEAAAPVRWHRRLFARGESREHPAQWIDLAHAVKRHTHPVLSGDVTDEKSRGRLRRAIGVSRRAIGQHRDLEAEDRVPIGQALETLRDTAASVGPAAPANGERRAVRE